MSDALALARHRLAVGLDRDPPFFEPLIADQWVVKSLLQKSIRRGEVEIAQRAALTFLAQKGSAIWRRYLVIAFEEVGAGSADVVAMTVAASTDSLLEIGELDDHGEHFWYYPTARTHAAALALRDRLDALIDLLRRRIYCVEGDPFREADPRVIPESHWLRPALWFDLRTGDLVQERDWDKEEVDGYRFEDGRENYAVRWRATMLIRTGQRSQRARYIQAVTKADRAKPKRIETKASSEKQCKAWLEAEMAASPDGPRQLRPGWLKEAKERWPDLSGRAFDRLWAASILKTGAAAWSASGPRNRSK
jgi:hypothetical protein